MQVDDCGVPIADSKLQAPFSRSDTVEEVPHLKSSDFWLVDASTYAPFVWSGGFIGAVRVA